MSQSDDFKVKWHESAPNRCPHCGTAPCLQLKRKLLMWPATGALCQTCGLKVTLSPGKATIVVLPIFVLVLAILPLMAISSSVVFLIALILAMPCVVAFPLAVMFWVPLRPDELSWPTKVRESQERVAAQRTGLDSENKDRPQKEGKCV